MLHSDTIDTNTEAPDTGLNFAKATVGTLTATALAACGGGGGSASGESATQTVASSATQTVASVGGDVVDLSSFDPGLVATDTQAARFLLQSQFHASEADIANVRQYGIRTWLQAQYYVPYQLGCDWMDAQGFNSINANNLHSTSNADSMVWHDLITTQATVRKRIALALSEFFVVGLPGLDTEWRSYLVGHYWDTLNRYALGSFRDLLGAITLNAGMGYYLNTKGNKKADGKGSQADENYAREIMQLFTIGLVELNLDGTVKKDGNNLPIDTYSSSDISNLAKVFTGYDEDLSQSDPMAPKKDTSFARLPLKQTTDKRTYSDKNHSSDDVTVFPGKTWQIHISGGATPQDALNQALDGLCAHPNVAPFFCKQMIQRLVTSNPSPAYVQAVAQKFKDSGGNLGQVFTAIWMHAEARGAIGTETGKLREPMLRYVQWARTFKAQSMSGKWSIDTSPLGQTPLRSPGVFNFFRPGYVPPSTALSLGKVAPEFQIVDESSVANYVNWLRRVVEVGLPNTNGAPADICPNYTQELTLVGTTGGTAAHVNRLNLLLAANQLSSATVNAIVTAIGSVYTSTAASSIPTELKKPYQVWAAIFLVMISPEYLIQK